MKRSYLSPATAKLTGKTLTARARLPADLVDEPVAEVELPAHAALREGPVGARHPDRASNEDRVRVDVEPTRPKPEPEASFHPGAEEGHHVVCPAQQVVAADLVARAPDLGGVGAHLHILVAEADQMLDAREHAVAFDQLI